ncbi:MAG: C40 family peptidase [Bacteroidota bacterium]
MTRHLLYLLLTIILLACESAPQDQDNQVESLIAELKSQFAPDGRVAIFKVEAKSSKGGLVLSGKTDMSEAKDALLSALDEKQVSYIDSLEVFPSEKLEGKHWGIINNSVSNIRSQPRHSGELATQALLGMPVKVLDQDGEWYLIQTPDDYISWIDHGGLILMNEDEYNEWQSTPKLIFTAVSGYAYIDKEESGNVSDLVLGDVLSILEESENHFEVGYPDGRTAFIRKSEATRLVVWISQSNNEVAPMIDQAMDLMGRPYLWGGTSVKGMDCSGFTKSLYLLNGLIIPRDASQQVHAGELIDDKMEWGKLQPGDLLFFGRPKSEESRERVVHVGMWIGDSSFIHASKQVRVSSVNSSAPNYDEFNTNRYLRTKRFVGSPTGNIINLREENIYTKSLAND